MISTQPRHVARGMVVAIVIVASGGHSRGGGGGERMAMVVVVEEIGGGGGEMVLAMTLASCIVRAMPSWMIATGERWRW